MTIRDAVLVDIGGTNVRFATLKADGTIANREAWMTDFYPDFASAYESYADVAGLKNIHAIGVCAAGPLVQDRINLTNCKWEIERAQVAVAAGTSRAILVNDFAAVARALPVLKANDLQQIGGTTPLVGAPMVALGPGTGLGVASTVPDGHGGWITTPGEGGHADLCPNNDREIAIIFQLMREYGHVSLERVLSGPGLEVLYLTIASLDGKTLKVRPIAQDIARAAHAGTDPAAVEAVSVFTAMLGGAAGNLALTLGAQGGVYIAGGIVRQWGQHFDTKLFRHRFEAKGRSRQFLSPIPCYLITTDDLAFRGLAAMLAQ
ncbi:MAG: glucokinase [Micropepsaceae bacterium]